MGAIINFPESQRPVRLPAQRKQAKAGAIIILPVVRIERNCDKRTAEERTAMRAQKSAPGRRRRGRATPA